jgi:head-tail adaptor
MSKSTASMTIRFQRDVTACCSWAAMSCPVSVSGLSSIWVVTLQQYVANLGTRHSTLVIKVTRGILQLLRLSGWSANVRYD